MGGEGLVRVGGARPQDPGRIYLGIGGASNSKLRRSGNSGSARVSAEPSSHAHPASVVRGVCPRGGA